MEIGVTDAENAKAITTKIRVSVASVTIYTSLRGAARVVAWQRLRRRARAFAVYATPFCRRDVTFVAVYDSA